MKFAVDVDQYVINTCWNSLKYPILRGSLLGTNKSYPILTFSTQPRGTYIKIWLVFDTSNNIHSNRVVIPRYSRLDHSAPCQQNDIYKYLKIPAESRSEVVDRTCYMYLDTLELNGIKPLMLVIVKEYGPRLPDNYNNMRLAAQMFLGDISKSEIVYSGVIQAVE